MASSYIDPVKADKHAEAQEAAAQISLRGNPRGAAQEVETPLVECPLMLRSSPLDLYASSITSTSHLGSLCLDSACPFLGPP